MELAVNLPNHPYNILIERGALNHVGQWVADLWKQQKIAIITDDTVQDLYATRLIRKLEAFGFEVVVFSVTPGEASKSFDSAISAYAFLAENEFTRSDGIIALGGGVVGDLAGFVASTFMRGIHFIQIPTTLLAQVDSSIGGKTAVNTPMAKNMVGTFAQPDGVLIDPTVLDTLEPRRVREGLAEIIKCGAIADLELWNILDGYKDEAEALENAETIIEHSLNVKRKVVVEDELDTGIRLILNFGHTIGHAIEATAGYGVVTHGEGVAIGMVQMNRVAEAKGLTPNGTTDALIKMLQKYNLPIAHEPWEVDKLYSALTHDKKTRGGYIKTIVLREIGEAYINKISIEEMKDFLNLNYGGRI
jgi:3-dehydroquinate synthase